MLHHSGGGLAVGIRGLCMACRLQIRRAFHGAHRFSPSGFGILALFVNPKPLKLICSSRMMRRKLKVFLRETSVQVVTRAGFLMPFRVAYYSSGHTGNVL